MAAAFRSGPLGHFQSLFDEGTCTGLSDARLLERFVTRGDEVAFAAMVERHGALVRNTCQAVLKDPNAAADAFQATFVLLFRKAGSIRGGDALGAWLHRVAYRTALQARSEAARRREVETSAPLARVAETADQDDLGAVLHEEIERLPERFRLPVVLCYLEGMTRDQAADYLRCTEGTIRGRLAKGRELLRHRLERRGLTLALPFASGSMIPKSLVATAVRAAAGGASGPVVALVASASRGGILARLAAAVVLVGVGIAATAMAYYSSPAGRPLRKGPIRPAVAIAAPASDDRTTTPIEGRILDHEGRPVAGATVSILRVQLPDGDNLDAWVDRAKRMENAQGGLSFGKAPGVSSATSGPDGRFRIIGLPRDAVVTASIKGPGIEASEIHVVTRDVPTFRLPLLPRGPINIYYGARFDHLAAPTRPIVGTVRDQDTGAPIPGVLITGTADIPRSGIPTPGIEATTDAQGRYRLVGLPVARGFRLFTEATGQPYVNGGFLCEQVAPGAGPFTFDIALKRGVLVRGRLTDKVTGRPLRGLVFYRAFGDNPHLDQYPNFKRGSRGAPLVIPDDGRFAIPALPGRGLITARAAEEGYLHGVGAESIKGLDRRMNAFFTAYPSPVGADVYNVYVEIDPASGAQEVPLELRADPGRTARGTILGPDGRPLLGGVEIHLLDVFQGPQQVPADSAKFAVQGIPPGRYRLDFLHRGRKLAGSVVLGGDETGELAVTLQPWGTVVGRIVDEEGKPRNDVRLWSTRRERPDPERGDLQDRMAAVDAQGRFRIEGLVPGIKYDADARSPRPANGLLFLKGVQVGPGEVKDLGDIRLPAIRKSGN